MNKTRKISYNTRRRNRYLRRERQRTVENDGRVRRTTWSWEEYMESGEKSLEAIRGQMWNNSDSEPLRGFVFLFAKQNSGFRGHPLGCVWYTGQDGTGQYRLVPCLACTYLKHARTKQNKSGTSLSPPNPLELSRTGSDLPLYPSRYRLLFSFKPR